MHIRVVVLILSCLLSFSLLAKVQQGKIDLANTFLASGETVNLQGEWYFSPQQWLKPDQPFEQQFLQVPGTWKQQLGHAKGIASYGLKITMPQHSSAQNLNMPF